MWSSQKSTKCTPLAPAFTRRTFPVTHLVSPTCCFASRIGRQSEAANSVVADQRISPNSDHFEYPTQLQAILAILRWQNRKKTRRAEFLARLFPEWKFRQAQTGGANRQSKQPGENAEREER